MFAKHFLAILLSGPLVLATAPAGFADQTSQQTNQSAPTNAKQTPEQVQQLVAPIALYPDELVAEVLAAATYPDQVVEADRWLQENKSLQGKQLADAVNKQPWDSSVKALTEFPSVLANMDKNVSWTSSLGGAYMNQQQDVMDAVQVMRQRAEKAGNLKDNSQQKVKKQGKTIIIEPANTQVVYVPTYDPWLVYGAPLGVWPGWYAYPGLYVATPGISFGFGFGVGFFGGYGWGWHHWGFDWGHRTVVFNHNTYISHSRTFINRTNVYRGRTAVGGHGYAGGTRAAGSRGFAGSHAAFGHPQHGSSQRAFGAANHAAMAGNRSFGGHSSFGGFHGGGGFHGAGGFHGGGGRR
jgi:Protein of unknown function (DUF3300)